MSQFTNYEKYHLYNYVYKTTDIDQKLDNLNTNSIICLFNNDVSPQKIMFGGVVDEWLVHENCVIKYIMLHIISTDNNASYEAITVLFNNVVIHSQTADQDQLFNWPNPNTVFLKNQRVHCKLLNSQAQNCNIKQAIVNVVYKKLV